MSDRELGGLVGPDGRRCGAEGFVTLDHVQGFARTFEHRVETIRLCCAAHNQHAADEMYGKAWMDRRRRTREKRREKDAPSPGTVGGR